MRVLIICFLIMWLFRVSGQESIMLPFLENGAYGVVDSQGAFILNPVQEPLIIDNELRLLYVKYKDGKSVYNWKGELLLSRLSRNLKLSKLDNRSDLVKVVDAQNKEVFFMHPDSKFVSMTYPLPSRISLNNGLFVELKYADGSFVLDKFGKKILEEKYKIVNYYGSMLSVGNNRFNTDVFVLENGELILYGVSGIKKSHWSYEILVQQDTSYIVEDGIVLSKYIDKNVDFCGNNQVVFVKDNILSVRDFADVEVLSVKGEEIFSPQNELSSDYYIFKDSNWGVIAKDGEVLIPPIHNSITEFGSSGLSIMTRNGLLLVDEDLDTINLLPGISAPTYKGSKNDLIYVANTNSYDPLAGVIDKNGNIVLQPFTSEYLNVDNNCGLIRSITEDGYSLYNKKGLRIYFNEKSALPYTCNGDTISLDFSDSIRSISKINGEYFNSELKRPITNKIDDWYMVTDCDAIMDSNTKCFSISCGPNEGMVVSTVLNNNKSLLVYVDGKMIIPEGFRFDKSSRFSPTMLSVTSRTHDSEVDYKVGLIDYKGNWIVKPSYGDFQSVNNGEYFIFKDIESFDTKLYSSCDMKEIELEVDLVENTGYFSSNVSVSRESPSTIIAGSLSNKHKLKQVVDQVELKNYNQIEQEISQMVQPAYKYSLYKDLYSDPIFDNLNYLSRIDGQTLVMEMSENGDDRIYICNEYGQVAENIEGQLGEVYNSVDKDKRCLNIYRDGFFGLSDFAGNLLTDIVYDSIRRSEVSSVFLLFKDSDKYMLTLNDHLDTNNGNQINTRMVYLGASNYQVRTLTKDFFRVVDIGDGSHTIFSIDGMYSLKKDYVFSSKRICSVYPPKGYLSARDSLVSNKAFFVNIRTGKELRN